MAQTLAIPALLASKDSGLSHKQRVDLALSGKRLDGPPFSFWHHFGLQTPEEHAKATLDFHWAYRTDIVKVMSDFPYPKPAGKWYELKVESNPFPQQLKALDLIREELSPADYRKFSEPFDRRIFEATAVAKLNVLHLHVEPAYLDFFRNFQAPIINYSQQVSGISIAEVRKRFTWVIAGVLLISQ